MDERRVPRDGFAMNETQTEDRKRFRKYLVVVAEAPETRIAAYYAARRAKHSKGQVALLYVVEPPDFTHWAAVTEAVRAEAWEKGEALLAEFTAEVEAEWGEKPEAMIREGLRAEEIKKAIEDDPDIAILILGAAEGEEGPGPLVSALAGRPDYLARRRIPVVVVPGGMTKEEMHGLA